MSTKNNQNLIRYKFSKTENKEFATILRQRTKAFFNDTGISPKGNTQMSVKSFIALSTYFIPFIMILFSGINSIPILFILWIVMGLGKAFIGTSVMHDALHGSYSTKKSINSLMSISALVIGVYPKNWKIQHNILHHTYTNIEHADEDISPGGILRFSPKQHHRWFHKYQHIYVLFFYSIFTLLWTFVKDFIKIFKYRKLELIKAKKEFRKHLIYIILSKIFYFSIFLVLPILLLPISPWLVFIMFISMHMVTGLVLSMVFQLAHIMPTSNFIEQEQQYIDQNWLVHQLQTTSNYSINNKLLSWFVGGLNFQVEHHLFPHICHVHYPRISKIVQQTATEFNLPYHSQENIRSAIITHFRMLRTLGREDRSLIS